MSTAYLCKLGAAIKQHLNEIPIAVPSRCRGKLKEELVSDLVGGVADVGLMFLTVRTLLPRFCVSTVAEPPSPRGCHLKREMVRKSQVSRTGRARSALARTRTHSVASYGRGTLTKWSNCHFHAGSSACGRHVELGATLFAIKSWCYGGKNTQHLNAEWLH